MSDWRDDLPPIPADRIRADVIREGHRRREQRRQRQRAVLYGAMGAAAITLIVVAGLLTNPATGDDDDAATDTGAAAGTAAAGPTTSLGAQVTEPAATEAPEGTEAPAETTGDGGAATTAVEGTAAETGGTEAAAGTTMVPHTTIGGPIGVLAPSTEVSVNPPAISEQASTPTVCGPSLVAVTYRPGTLPMRAPVVHWETAGVVGEAPMVVVGGYATATVGPFAAETLDAGVVHELLVWVTDDDAAGAQHVFRAPTVLLRDCSR